MRTATLLTLSACSTLFVSCEVDDGDLETQTCSAIFDLCEETLYDGDDETCRNAMTLTADCRKNCVLDQFGCNGVETCLKLDMSDSTVAFYCDEAEDNNDDKTDQGGAGVCFWEYNTGDQWGFGCQNDIENRDACEAWVNQETNNGEWALQWEFMVECIEQGCSGECGPDWWSLY